MPRLTLNDRVTPAPVLTPRRFTFLTATNNTTCGRTATEGTYCWGANEFAQLGAGFTGQGTLSAAPIPVARP